MTVSQRQLHKTRKNLPASESLGPCNWVRCLHVRFLRAVAHSRVQHSLEQLNGFLSLPCLLLFFLQQREKKAHWA